MEPLQPENRTEPHRKIPESTENPSHHKKTRDLPNLNECHACGFKVDVCAGKNGLRTLYSEWRVVLLCSKCFSSVESSQICSYCFSETSPDSFRCIQCRHSVHKNCFSKYKNSAPWSYACLGSEFSVCVDCWIPKSVAVSRSRRIRVDGGMLKKKGRVMVQKGNSISRVLGGGDSVRSMEDVDSVRSMEDVVKDANHAMEKKVEAAARAREEAIKKAAVARRAVEIANNALGLVAKRKEGGRKIDAVKFFGGSVLTLKLHPLVNSSLRNSKSRCLMNTSYLDNPKRWASSVVSSFKTSNSRNASGCDNHEVSRDNKLYGDSHKSLCEPSNSVGSLDTDSSTEFDVEEIGEELMNEGEGSCSDRLINYSGEDSGLELEERCNGQPDRYFLKYRRRNTDRYFLKYRRRNTDRCFLKYMRRNCRLKPNQDSQPKILCDKIYCESQDSAAGLPFSCSGSGELRTISDASFLSFHAPLQASPCESGHFREPS